MFYSVFWFDYVFWATSQEQGEANRPGAQPEKGEKGVVVATTKKPGAAALGQNPSLAPLAPFLGLTLGQRSRQGGPRGGQEGQGPAKQAKRRAKDCDGVLAVADGIGLRRVVRVRW